MKRKKKSKEKKQISMENTLMNNFNNFQFVKNESFNIISPRNHKSFSMKNGNDCLSFSENKSFNSFTQKKEKNKLSQSSYNLQNLQGEFNKIKVNKIANDKAKAKSTKILMKY